MRCVLVLALALAPLGVAHAAEADLAAHLKRVREASGDARPAALREAAKAIQQVASVPEEDRETCTALLGEARSATAAKDKALGAAGWVLAVPLMAVTKPVRAEDAAWFLEHVGVAWDARTTDEAARAAIHAALGSLYDGTTEAAALGKAADRTLKKLLGAKGYPQRFLALAIGLAHAPTKRARARLARALPRKGLGDDEVVSILQALGETGGSGAAPILLDHVPGTAAVVLEAALIGLSKLDAVALREHGKEILSVTMKDNENHYRVMLALTHKSKLSRKERKTKSLLATRAKAWTTDKIFHAPLVEVPPGIGHRGVEALWWKIIDALGKRIKSPEPPKDARPQVLNGRPNMRGQAWFLWWRRTR